MRECCICHGFLVRCNEGLDHIGVESFMRRTSASSLEEHRRVVFICQSCLNAIQNQLEYGLSYKYAEV